MNQRIDYSSWEQDRAHRDRVIKKLERIQTLKALLEMWEAKLQPDDDYLLHLRRRLRNAEHQYVAMKP